MIYGSVCSGIEAASTAWHGPPLNWEPAFFSEIEPFPSSVLRRWPNVRNLGDFTTIRNHWLRRIGVGPIDLLVGGTPCQSFSVAGLRGGMADARGNLALEFLRLARRLRPRWIVWENVPGVQSSWSDEAAFAASEESHRDVEQARLAAIEAGLDLGTGFGPGEFEEVDQANDFDCFLTGLEKLGYGWSYRVLDAQHFGVPQRRRRVFVVGYSGDVGGLGHTPSDEDVQRFSRISASVLFERHCLSGNPPEGGTAGTDATGCLTRSLGSGGPDDTRAQSGHLLPFSSHGHGHFRSGLGMVTARDAKDGFHSGLIAGVPPSYVPDVAFAVKTQARRIGQGWNDTMIAHTLRGEGFDASEDGTGRSTPLIPMTAPTLFASNGGVSSGYHPIIPAYQCHGSNVGPMGTLRAGNGNETGGVPFIVNAAESCATQSHARQSETARCLDQTGGFATNQGGTVIAVPAHDDTAFCLPASSRGTGDGHGQGWNSNYVIGTESEVAAFDPRNVTSNVNRTRVEPGLPSPTLHQQGMPIIGSGVRRLTPVECERLQGFPDGHTQVDHNGKPAADGPRYKAIGNSMAVPCMAWIGRRIDMVDALLKSLETT